MGAGKLGIWWGTCGTRRKRLERAHGTPAFAIHPAGYDPKAADAQKTETEKK